MSISEIEAEQAYLDVLYGRLDLVRDRTATELAKVRRAGASGTPQARSERDAFATLYEDRLTQLNGVEERLCFGRLDMRDHSTRYIGRLGLFDDDQTQLLVDWRAPASRDFYQATSLHPGDVIRRRHLETHDRKVGAIYDDVLDLDHFEQRPDLVAHTSESTSLTTDGALLAALNASRTGRMTDIVATIQSEQDEIVRAPMTGMLVVQGGPGTGKTAVALHRAAYLLYTHRDRLESRGVLLVGPSPVFLRYISQVLPSLGETGVVTATADELMPGISVTAVDTEAAAALKGSLRMAKVLDRAVRQRLRLPKSDRSIKVGSVTLRLRPRVMRSAAEAARRGGRSHNAARVVFVRHLLQHLIDLYANATGQSADTVDRSDVEHKLRDSRDVRRELNLAWPALAAEQVLADLFASPERLFAATPDWTNDERVHLLRERGSGWTSADVPLLDELAELIGEDDAEAAAESQRERQAAADELQRAREVLQSVGGLAAQLVSAQSLAARFVESGPVFTVAERAFADRTWAYGHIIVDEAQELSPMMWRLLLRRCPTRSFTIVGDISQATGPAAAHSWDEALSPHVGARWERRDLTINYRTPAQVMDRAYEMLAATGHDAEPPTSVREGEPPQTVPVSGSDDVLQIVSSEAGSMGDRRLAVIAPEARLAGLTEALQRLLVSTSGDDLQAPVVLLTPEQAKGLEFDIVVVVDPDGVVAESRHGHRALFVAMTRPTQRLVIAEWVETINP
ncbi:MAG TPA: ATP-binding domain-containing protein [Actinomycetes bacterium]|nr:ATP-binding domain-containing protein [Actinomycetes bacterium]